MTMYNNPYSNQGYYPQSGSTMTEGGELSETEVISAETLGNYDEGYTLLPEGDYAFTVVDLKTTRFQPGPNSSGKIGACKQITLVLQVVDPTSGKNVDLNHNLYMWNSAACTGMIAQFYDAIGNHKKGEPLRFDWRPEVIIGKTGKLKLSHRIHRDDTNKPADQQRKYNNISRLYPLDPAAASAPRGSVYQPGRF